MQIPEEKILSFDVFDTALRRDFIHPTHVFCQLENDLQMQFPGTDWHGFAHSRRRAEEISRENIRWKKREEHNMEEIYEALRKLLPKISAHQIKFARQMELDLEKKFIHQNEDFYRFYQEARLRKKIFFLSDTYLSFEFVRDLLLQHGYDISNNLYVSSQIGKTKQKGTLFQFFLDRENLNSEEVRHFGDNPHSDVEMAHRSGMKATLYRGPHQVEWTKPMPLTAGLSILSRIQAQLQNSRNSETNIWTRMGKSYGALIYGGYLKWLHDKLVETDLRDIYFLSRDGHILHHIAQRLSPFSHWKTHYLCVSRRVLNLSKIKDHLQPEDLDFLLGGHIPQSPVAYLRRIGIPEKEARALARRHFRSIDQTRDPNLYLHQYQALFRSAEDQVLTLCSGLRERLSTYLRQEGLCSQKRFAIADLGWHGTLQLSLQHLVEQTGQSPEIHGFYYGLFQKAGNNRTRGLLLHSYTVNEFHTPDEQETIQQLSPFLEKLFSAPHGGVCDYQVDPSGRVHPLFSANPEELQEYKEKIQIFQQGALETLLQRDEEIRSEQSLEALKSLALYPSSSECRLFGELVHFDGFEHSGPGQRLVDTEARPRSARHYERLYERSYWRPGLLRHFADHYPQAFEKSPLLRTQAKLQGLI